jgi:hypothetical protein
LHFSQGTYSYELPTTLSTVQDIYVSVSGETAPSPEPIDNDLWELVDGNIHFNQRADSTIPSGGTLFIKGRYKLTVSDEITKERMQEYVLAVAGANTLTLLTHKKANLFIKNDTTMGELIALRRELMNDVKELRTKLLKEYESA